MQLLCRRQLCGVRRIVGLFILQGQLKENTEREPIINDTLALMYDCERGNLQHWGESGQVLSFRFTQEQMYCTQTQLISPTSRSSRCDLPRNIT